MDHLKEFEDDYFLFLEAGFIAINKADEDAASKLFKACSLLKPDNMLSKVGEGYLHLHKLELNKAIECFKEVVKKEPDNEMANTMLGIALSLSPSKAKEGAEVLQKSLNNSNDDNIKSLAKDTLSFVDSNFKKNQDIPK